PWDLSFGGRFGFTRVPVGDREFDERVKIRGSVEDVVPLMDAETRSSVREFIDAGGEAARGKLTLRFSGILRDEGVLVGAARALIALGDHLSLPGRTKLLLANVLSDPAPGVRVRNLEVLAGKFRHSQEARAGTEAALDDSEPEVRLAAAEIE